MDQNVEAIYAANKDLEQCHSKVFKLTLNYDTVLPSNDHIERQQNAADMKKGVEAIRDNLHAVEMLLRELDYRVAEQNAANNLTRWLVQYGTDREHLSQRNYYTLLATAKDTFAYTVATQKRNADPLTRRRHSTASIVELVQMNPDGSWEVLDKYDPNQK